MESTLAGFWARLSLCLGTDPPFWPLFILIRLIFLFLLQHSISHNGEEQFSPIIVLDWAGRCDFIFPSVLGSSRESLWMVSGCSELNIIDPSLSYALLLVACTEKLKNSFSFVICAQSGKIIIMCFILTWAFFISNLSLKKLLNYALTWLKTAVTANLNRGKRFSQSSEKRKASCDSDYER